MWTTDLRDGDEVVINHGAGEFSLTAVSANEYNYRDEEGEKLLTLSVEDATTLPGHVEASASNHRPRSGHVARLALNAPKSVTFTKRSITTKD